jgi:hypothetical protein
VAFEDNPNDVIETQRSSAVAALMQRAEALRQALIKKGLTPLETP